MAFALRPTYRRLVAFNPSYCAEAQALFAAMTVQPTRGRKARINELIGRLKASSVWTKLDLLYVLAAHDEQAGRLNWKSPGIFTLTAINSPTFRADRSFNGDGSTSWLDTAWDWATNGVQYTLNNAHMSIYTRTAASNVPCWGSKDGSSRAHLAGQAGTAAASRMNSLTNVNGGAGGTQPLFSMNRRNDAVNSSFLRDGVQTTAPTAAASTTTASTADFGLGACWSAFAADQMSIATAGAYLDDTEALALYNACNAYMVALGADT